MERRARGGSEEPDQEAGQHPRHADAEADDGEILLGLNCFHAAVLKPEGLIFCALDHTANFQPIAPAGGCPRLRLPRFVIFITSSRFAVRHDPGLRNIATIVPDTDE